VGKHFHALLDKDTRLKSTLSLAPRNEGTQGKCYVRPFEVFEIKQESAVYNTDSVLVSSWSYHMSVVSNDMLVEDFMHEMVAMNVSSVGHLAN